MAAAFHEEPVHPCLPLFDPDADELPPHEAIELYHEPPPVLSVIHTVCTTEGDSHGWKAATEAAWAASRAAAIKALRQRLYVKVGTHHQRRGLNSVGIFWPARLRLTCVSHLYHPETEPYAQMHDHIYIGAKAYPDTMPMGTGAGLPSWEADNPWPIDRYSLTHNLASEIDAFSEIAAQQEFTALTGAAWTPIPEVRAPATIPGFEEAALTYPRFECPGPERAAPDAPLSWPEFLAKTLDAYPDRLMPEQRWELEHDARARFRRLLDTDRIVLRDLIYPHLHSDD